MIDYHESQDKDVLNHFETQIYKHEESTFFIFAIQNICQEMFMVNSDSQFMEWSTQLCVRTIQTSRPKLILVALYGFGP